MSEQAFDEAARILARDVGLRVDPTIRSRLTRAVRHEAENRGLDLTDYVVALDHDPDALQDLLNRVTVQETSFFRDPGQFEALAEHVLPSLRARGRPLLVWSAGCANGQEPYSLAMSLAESGCAEWTIVASDISTRALQRAREARYRPREMTGLSDERRRRFFRPCGGDQLEVVPALRERVTIVRHNLAADPPPFEPQSCDVVFCRNVLIYFDHADVVAVIDRLARWLGDSAYLFLGYSESLWQVSDRFQLVRLGDAFVYRPAAAGRTTSLAPRVPAARTTRPDTRRAPTPPRSPRPVPTPTPTPAVAPSAVELFALGEAAFEAGDHQGAIAAFRKATYIDPDHPIAHLNLGLSFEAAGDVEAAKRAYAASRAALNRAESAVVEATLEGYHLSELHRLLDLKVGED